VTSDAVITLLLQTIPLPQKEALRDREGLYIANEQGPTETRLMIVPAAPDSAPTLGSTWRNRIYRALPDERDRRMDPRNWRNLEERVGRARPRRD